MHVEIGKNHPDVLPNTGLKSHGNIINDHGKHFDEACFNSLQ